MDEWRNRCLIYKERTLLLSNYITAGSFSRLSTFAKCKLWAYFAYAARIPEPDRGPGPLKNPHGGYEWHNDRGSRIHDEIEQYIRGESDYFPLEAKNFVREIEYVKELFEAGNDVQMEDMWMFDSAWEPTENHKEAFFRIKVDLLIIENESIATVIDYKSGKRWGNEIKHAEQLQGYAVGTALRYPEIDAIFTENWYIDQKELISMNYRRNQALKFLKGLNQRVLDMVECRNFKPSPSMYTCKWCPYKTGGGGTGDCDVNPDV